MSDTNKIDKIIADLGTNYIEGEEEVIKEIFDEVSSIASNISNRKVNDVMLLPYINKATKAMYLSRGAEGLQSRGEGSISSSYEDIVDKLRNDIVKNGLRRIK